MSFGPALGRFGRCVVRGAVSAITIAVALHFPSCVERRAFRAAHAAIASVGGAHMGFVAGPPVADAARRSSMDARGIDDAPIDRSRPALRPQTITLADGRRFSLNAPRGFRIDVAAEGLRRVRFMAFAPDGRLFVTDMHDKTDNSKGVVYVLDGFDSVRGRFARVTSWLGRLRNPNSLAFFTDDAGAHWLYLALTDCLLRYRYTPGENAPSGPPDTLTTFPAYGLSYKYGGWHLTRTVAVGADRKLYVAVGSSCNACEEKEEVRASVLQMDLDGRNQRLFARGLRNAVGLRFVDGRPFVTNMGSDHLGDDRPEETMYELASNADYGWPYCYQYRGRVHADPRFSALPRRVAPKSVPRAYQTFPAHSAPLGLEYFGGFRHRALDNYFLVALHGSTNVSLQRGYTVVRAKRGSGTYPFVTGFLSRGRIHGRPCDVLRAGDDGFFLTDDHAGVVYYVHLE